MYQVEVLDDKGNLYADGPKFDSVDDAMDHVHSLLRQWIIVQWRVIDDTGAEVKRGGCLQLPTSAFEDSKEKL